MPGIWKEQTEFVKFPKKSKILGRGWPKIPTGCIGENSDNSV